MIIKWRPLYTINNYPVFVYRPNNGYSDVILLGDATKYYVDDNNTGKPHKSLTNNMEEVLDHFLIGLNFGKENLDKIKFFQWCEDEGLFRIDFNYIFSRTKGISYNLKWTFISKDLKAFEVLYCV